MTISLIVAASTNNAIGKNNQLLWHLPEDLRYFKNMTWGMPVVMGRKTFEAVGKPFPGRTNIVITSNKDWRAEGAQTANSLEAAINSAAESNAKEIFITGGGEIYRQSMEIANKIYLTRVHAEPEGDSFFPELNVHDWTLSSNRDMPADEKHQYSMSFQIYVRKAS